jgi:hypothetical protein
MAHRQNAGEQDENGYKQSQRAVHFLTNAARVAGTSSSRENSRKAVKLSCGNPQDGNVIASRRGEAIGIMP